MAGAAAHKNGGDCPQVKACLHNGRQDPLCITAPILLDRSLSAFGSMAAAVSIQDTFFIWISVTVQPGTPAHLFHRFINTADNAKLKAAAGSRIRDSIIQPHQVHSPAANVHQKNRRLIPDVFRMESKRRIALGEQFHILDCQFIRFIFVSETKRLLLPEQILP